MTDRSHLILSLGIFGVYVVTCTFALVYAKVRKRRDSYYFLYAAILTLANLGLSILVYQKAKAWLPALEHAVASLLFGVLMCLAALPFNRMHEAMNRSLS